MRDNVAADLYINWTLTQPLRNFRLAALHTCAFEVHMGMDPDGLSDTTLDELQSPYLDGEPLTRMIEFEYMETPSSRDTDFDAFEGCLASLSPAKQPADQFVRDEEINYIEEEIPFLPACNGGNDGEGSLFSTFDPEYVRSVVDHMTANPLASSSPKISFQSVPHHPSQPLLVRRIRSDLSSAREVALWRYMNSATMRRDPWNPSPPALIVEHHLPVSAEPASYATHLDDKIESETYIIMGQLRSLRDNPLRNTDDVIDFSRQLLQGLVFLHEHNITHASYTLSNDESGFESIMMDIGLAPPHALFSRYDFPVKYYILDFTTAMRMQTESSSPPCALLPYNLQRKAAKAPHTNPMIKGTPPNVTATLPGSCRARAYSVPAINITSSQSAYITPPDCAFNLETSKRPHLFIRPKSLQDLSDPEGAEVVLERDEDGVTIVCAAIQALHFAADLRHVADILEEVSPVASFVGKTLTPVITAMRRAQAISFSAEDALRMFESVVRPLVGANVEFAYSDLAN